MTRVLVTGADGFIGSHLVEALVARGCNVRAMALYNSYGRRGWLDALPPETLARVEVVMSDIRDARLCAQAVKECAVVYHLAAWGGVPFSFVAPQTYIDTNVTGTSNVMLAALDAGCSRVLHTSTSEIFGTPDTVPISEHNGRKPQSPYAASKVAADALVQSYVASFGLPAVICRPFNTYGPRQSDRAVIPTIVGQLLAGARTLRLGALDPTRDLTYVTDTCAGMIALAESGLTGEFNLGTGTEIRIGDLARRLMELTGCEAEIHCEPTRLRPGQSEVMRLLSDNRRVQQATGWAPAVSLDDGLQRTIDWLRENQNTVRPLTYAV